MTTTSHEHDPAAFRPVTDRDHAIARASRDDFWDWLGHVTPAGDRHGLAWTYLPSGSIGAR